MLLRGVCSIRFFREKLTVVGRFGCATFPFPFYIFIFVILNFDAEADRLNFGCLLCYYYMKKSILYLHYIGYFRLSFSLLVDQIPSNQSYTIYRRHIIYNSNYFTVAIEIDMYFSDLIWRYYRINVYIVLIHNECIVIEEQHMVIGQFVVHEIF